MNHAHAHVFQDRQEPCAIYSVPQPSLSVPPTSTIIPPPSGRPATTHVPPVGPLPGHRFRGFVVRAGDANGFLEALVPLLHDTIDWDLEEDEIIGDPLFSDARDTIHAPADEHSLPTTRP